MVIWYKLFFEDVLETRSAFVSPVSLPSRALKHNVHCHIQDPVEVKRSRSKIAREEVSLVHYSLSTQCIWILISH
jgi:hypothetical protein